MRIPQSHQDLLEDETKAFGFLGTIMRNGTPQVTPLWFDWDGEAIWVNSSRGRLKDINMRSRPYVAITIMDPQDPYRYMQIRGSVVDITEEGAEEHIHILAHKYTGKPYQHLKAGEKRVRYKIVPEKVHAK